MSFPAGLRGLRSHSVTLCRTRDAETVGEYGIGMAGNGLRPRPPTTRWPEWVVKDSSAWRAGWPSARSLTGTGGVDDPGPGQAHVRDGQVPYHGPIFAWRMKAIAQAAGAE